VVVLGPPGSGKSTQASRVAEALHVPHLSSGDLLRREVEAGTPLGRRVEDGLARGELLPDDLITDFVLHRLTELGADPGFVLDGFPRSVPQAQAAARWDRSRNLWFETVVWLEVAHDELVQRLLERGRSAERADDTYETILHRLELDDEVTEPLKRLYRDLGLLVDVDGSGDLGDVTERVLTTLTEADPAWSQEA